MALKSKPCQATNCNNPRWGGGYCSQHQNLRKDGKKVIGLQSSGSSFKVAQKPKKAAKRESYVPFFAEAMQSCTKQCQECGKRIPEIHRQWSIAHILPKAYFASIAFNQEAWIELCPDCHHAYDNKGWDHAQTMKIWPVVVEKFLAVYPLIKTKDEHRRIPEQLLSYVDQQ